MQSLLKIIFPENEHANAHARNYLDKQEQVNNSVSNYKILACWKESEIFTIYITTEISTKFWLLILFITWQAEHLKLFLYLFLLILVKMHPTQKFALKVNFNPSSSNPRKRSTQSNNSSVVADELFERVWPFCGVGV